MPHGFLSLYQSGGCYAIKQVGACHPEPVRFSQGKFREGFALFVLSGAQRVLRGKQIPRYARNNGLRELLWQQANPMAS